MRAMIIHFPPGHVEEHGAHHVREVEEEEEQTAETHVTGVEMELCGQLLAQRGVTARHAPAAQQTIEAIPEDVTNAELGDRDGRWGVGDRMVQARTKTQKESKWRK